MQRLLVLFTAAFAFLPNLLFAVAAQADYKIKDLAGDVAIDFYDVRFEKNKSRVDFENVQVVKGRRYKTECWVLAGNEGNQNPRLLQRTAKFTAKQHDVVDRASDSFGYPIVTFQGHYDSDRIDEGAKRRPSLYCWVTDEKDRINREMTTNLSVGDIQRTLGRALDGTQRITIHLGSDNFAKKASNDGSEQRVQSGDPRRHRPVELRQDSDAHL